MSNFSATVSGVNVGIGFATTNGENIKVLDATAQAAAAAAGAADMVNPLAAAAAITASQTAMSTAAAHFFADIHEMQEQTGPVTTQEIAGALGDITSFIGDTCILTGAVTSVVPIPIIKAGSEAIEAIGIGSDMAGIGLAAIANSPPQLSVRDEFNASVNKFESAMGQAYGSNNPSLAETDTDLANTLNSISTLVNSIGTSSFLTAATATANSFSNVNASFANLDTSINLSLPNITENQTGGNVTLATSNSTIPSIATTAPVATFLANGDTSYSQTTTVAGGQKLNSSQLLDPNGNLLATGTTEIGTNGQTASLIILPSSVLGDTSDLPPVELPTLGSSGNQVTVVTSGNTGALSPGTIAAGTDEYTGSTVNYTFKGQQYTATVLYKSPDGYVIDGATEVGGTSGISFNGPTLLDSSTTITGITPPPSVATTVTLENISYTSDGTQVNTQQVLGSSNGMLQSSLTTNTSATGQVSSSATNIYDPETGYLLQSYTTNANGIATLTLYDGTSANNVTSQTTLNGQGQVLHTNTPSSLPYGQFAAAAATTFADQVITKFLFKNNLPASLAAEAFAGTSIEEIQKLLGGNPTTLMAFKDLNVPQQFAATYGVSLAQIAANLGGSALGADLFKDLGLPSQVGSVVGGVVSQQVVDQIINSVAGQTFGIATKAGATTAVDIVSFEAAFTNAGAAAIGDYLGTDLSDLVIGSPTIDSSIGGAVGGAVGGAAGAAEATALAEGISGALGTIILPGIGVLIGSALGSFLGSLIGSIFGPGVSVGPNGTAGLVFNSATNQFFGSGTLVDNGGDPSIPTGLAQGASDELNAILTSIGGTAVLSASTPTLTIGYYAERGVFAITDGPYYTTSQAAIDVLATTALSNISIKGGNPFMEYALAHCGATTVAQFITDLNAAYDYGNYIANPLTFDMGLALTGSAAQYSTWLGELQEAQSMGLGTAPGADGDLTGTVLNDSSSYVLSNLEIINDFVTSKDITQITLTDVGNTTLTLTAAQAANYSAALNAISSPVSIAVYDSWANIVANAGAIENEEALGKINSINLTNSIPADFSTLQNLGTVNNFLGLGGFNIIDGSGGTGTFTQTTAGQILIGDSSNDIYNLNQSDGAVMIENYSVGYVPYGANPFSNLIGWGAANPEEVTVVGNDIVIVSVFGRQEAIEAIILNGAQIPGIYSGGIQNPGMPRYPTAGYGFYQSFLFSASDAAMFTQMNTTFNNLNNSLNLLFEDSAANISANVDALQMLYAQGRIETIYVTDPAPVYNITYQQFRNDAPVLDTIVGPAPGVINIYDSSVNIAANINSLQILTSEGEISNIYLTDSNPLTISASQISSSVLSKIVTAYNLAIADTSANIVTNLTAINALAVSGKIASIKLTDGGTPNLQLTAAQMASDSAALSKLSGSFTIAVSNAATSLAISLSSDNITLADNSSVAVTGAQDIINANTGDTLKNSGSNGVINITANNIVSITGATDTVNATGTGNSVTGVATDVVNVSGTGQTTVAATLDAVTLSNGKLNLAVTSSANLTGSSNAVTLLSNDNLNITGGSNTVTSGTSTGDNISIISGVNNILTTAAGNTISVAGDGQVTAIASMDTLNATSDTIKLAATSSATIKGNSNIITGLASDNIYVTGSTNIATIATSSNITLAGTGNKVTGVATDVVNVSGNGQTTVAANLDTVTLSSGKVNIAVSSSVVVNGSSNTITALANDNVTVTGATNTISSLGATDNVSITGNGNIIMAPVAATAVTDTLTLDGNTVAGTVTLGTATATGLLYTLSGTTLTIASGTDKLTINNFVSGDFGIKTLSAFTYNQSNSTISIPTSANAVVTGSTNTITALTGDIVTVSGNTNKATIGAGSTITLAGTGNNVTGVATDIVNVSGTGQTTITTTLDTVTLTSGKLNLAATSSANLAGSGNTVTLLSNDNLNITGGSNTVTSGTSTGDNISIISGVNNIITTVAGDTLSIAGDGQVTAVASMDTLNATSNTIKLAATSSATINGSSNTITGLASDNIYVTGNNNKATIAAGSNITLAGTGNSVTGVATDVVNVSGTGQTTVAATLDAVTLTSGKLNLAVTSSANLTGSSNAVTLLSNDNLNITGGSNTVTSGTSTGDNISIISGVNNILTTAAGNTISVAGDGQVTAIASMDTLNATSDTIKLAATSSATINGSSNTITGLASDNIYVTGNNNKATIAAGSNITLAGTGNSVTGVATDVVNVSGNGQTTVVATLGTVTLSSGKVNLAATSSAVINGSGDTITALANDNVTVTGATNTISSLGATDNVSITGNGNIITAPVAATAVTDTLTLDGKAVAGTVTLGTATATGLLYMLSGTTLTIASGTDKLTINNFVSGDFGIKTLLATVVYNQSNSTINVAANTNASITGDSNTITGLAGDIITVNGVSNNITSANNNTVNVTGNNTIVYASAVTGDNISFVSGTNNQITATAGNIISVAGDGVTTNDALIDTLNTTSDTIILAANSTVNVEGNGNIITASTGDDINIFGNNNKLVEGAGSNAYVEGTGDIITAANGSEVNIGSNGQTTTAANFYTVNLTNGFVYTDANTSFNIVGSVNEIDAENNNNINVSGGGNAIYAGGITGDNISIISGLNNVITATAGNTISVAGDGQVTSVTSMERLNTTADTIKLAATSSATILGNGNTITGLTNDNVYVTGNTNTVTVGTGSNVVISGTGDIINAAASDTVNINAGSAVTVNGSSNLLNFVTGSGNTTIALTSSGTNTINFGTTITDEQLWFKQSGNNLLIDVLGSNEQITLSNWYSASSNQAQEITANGLNLDTQFTQLVQAMATYSAANTGFNPLTATTMPTDTILQGAITAAWHH